MNLDFMLVRTLWRQTSNLLLKVLEMEMAIEAIQSAWNTNKLTTRLTGLPVRYD